MSNSTLTTSEKIKLYKSLFCGFDHVYGTYDVKSGKVRQVKEPVTDKVILNHLTGRQPYGVYLLVYNKISALAVDFDQDDLALPVDFVVAAGDYGLPTYIERSKSKGHHVWMFFEEEILARKARLVAQKILTDIGFAQTEIFPKQDCLDQKVSYGNFINAPLFGTLVLKERTVFLESDDPTAVCQDQWQFLKDVKRIGSEQIDWVIQQYRLDQSKQQIPPQNPNDEPVPNEKRHSFGLPPCARKMLTEGVTANQRVCAFRLAIHLGKIGLSYDIAVATLIAWSKKNRPDNGKGVITEAEIQSQAKYAYQRHYRGFGCEDPAINVHCDSRCSLYKVTNQ